MLLIVNRLYLLNYTEISRRDIYIDSRGSDQLHQSAVNSRVRFKTNKVPSSYRRLTSGIIVGVVLCREFVHKFVDDTQFDDSFLEPKLMNV